MLDILNMEGLEALTSGTTETESHITIATLTQQIESGHLLSPSTEIAG